MSKVDKGSSSITIYMMRRYQAKLCCYLPLGLLVESKFAQISAKCDLLISGFGLFVCFFLSFWGYLKSLPCWGFEFVAAPPEVGATPEVTPYKEQLPHS